MVHEDLVNNHTSIFIVGGITLGLKETLNYWKRQIEYWEKSNEPVINAAVKLAEKGGVGIERLKGTFEKAPEHTTVQISKQEAAELQTQIIPFQFVADVEHRDPNQDTSHPYSVSDITSDAVIMNKGMDHRRTQKKKIGVYYYE
jgi:hypothetical protein